MRVSAFLAGLLAACVLVSGGPAESADGRGFLNFAGALAPQRQSPAPPHRPRFHLPGKPRFGGIRHCPFGMKPSAQGCVRVGPAVSHACPPGTKRVGRSCLNVGGTTSANACPPGWQRLPRRGCVKGEDVVRPCPPGKHRVRGKCVDDGEVATTCPPGKHRHGRRCVTNDDGVRPCPRGMLRRHGRCVDDGADDSDVVIVDPGPACAGNSKRRGKRCVPVGPETSSDADDGSHETAEPARPGRDAKPARAQGPSVVIGPPATIPPDIRAMVDRPHRSREIVVLMAATDVAASVTELSRRYNLVAAETQALSLVDGAVVRFTLADRRPIEAVLAAMAGDPLVLLAQPNQVYTASDDGAGGSAATLPQYAPERIRLEQAHALARGRGVLVAVIDTGCDLEHAELAGAVAASYDSLNEGERQAEEHGTAIAGIVAARRSLTGIAPDARLLTVRAFAGDGTGPAKSTSLAIAKGIEWAFGKKARIVNMSFAGSEDALLQRVIVAAARKGVIFVAAAGNGGPEAAPQFPAAYADVIAVTATDDRDGVYALAGRGAHVAIAAPGVDIVAPAPGGAYNVSSGTSMAAAHVSGVIAIMLERDPELAPGDVRAILTRTAHKLAEQESAIAGAGLVDAAAAATETGDEGRTQAAAE